MKAKLYLLFILLMFTCRPLAVQAVEHNFAAGSLIIPMDQFYQSDDDGGILEAYGLVYYLLAHQDQAGLQACASEPTVAEQEACEALVLHDITVYWLIDENKTDIEGPDLIIQDDTLTNTAVVDLFNHTAGGSPTTLTFDTANGDNAARITYRGGIWAIDINDLTRSTNPDLDDLAAVEAIIRNDNWSQVEVHVAQVPFAANVFRKMQGKPPRIALMNSEEDLTKGNAEILESYLRLAGICPDVYDVISPNDIGGIVDVGNDNNADKHVTSALFNDDGTLAYDFLWAPHWTGEDKYNGDKNLDTVRDVDEIVLQVRQYLRFGGAMLAECASIETFEYNVNGHFLTDHGFAHNGGSNDPAKVVYNDVAAPYSQIGDFGGFNPEGGHLHNWRPFQVGDDDDFNFDVVPTQNSSYNDTVTRYTVDDNDTPQDGVDDLDWDYYVGGYAFGQSYNGYVVYLGGHKYAKCKDDKSVAEKSLNVHPVKLEFEKDVRDEIFTLEVGYHCPHNPYTLTVTDWDVPTDFGSQGLVEQDERLQIDFRNATVSKKKKLEGIEFRNLRDDEELFIDSITLSWTNGATSDASQKIKKLIDQETDIKHYDDKTPSSLVLTDIQDFTIDPSPGGASGIGCSQNDNCEWTNIAGVRYVLNTLFNIKYMKGISRFARAAPIVSHPYLYQGYFGWEPRQETWVDDYMVGHFRRYDITQTVPTGGVPLYDWDTAVDFVGSPPTPLIPLAADGNSNGRQVFTAENDGSGNFSKINFDFAHIDDLRVPLDLTPDTGAGEDDDEKHLINRVRGKRWNYTADTPVYVDDPNRLGGIMHSAPVIVRDGAKDSRFTGREEVAYVGDLNGMLHAVRTATGQEKWAYIPSNLLGKLQNVRGDSTGNQDFAAVDGSPTIKHIYYNLDHDPDDNPTWHSILVCPQGFGGNSIFALDVTDPDDWKVLWEADGSGQISTITCTPNGNFTCTLRECTTEPASGAAEICDGGAVKYCSGDWVSSLDICTADTNSCTPTASGFAPRVCTTEPVDGVAEPCHDGVVMFCHSNYNSNQDTCNKPWEPIMDWNDAVACPAGAWLAREDCTEDQDCTVSTTEDYGMGHAFRASIDRVRVRVPVLDGQGVPIAGQYEYKVEWRVFVATGFNVGVDEKGGINVYAFDLKTGAKKWTFSSEYANSVNDIPGAITTFDTDDDTFADRIYVGDMNGRMWALNTSDPDPAVSGDPDRSVFNTAGGTPIPMFSAGVDYPISVSPAIMRHNGHVLLAFGTGGADWAGDDLVNRIYVVDTTRAEQLSQTQIDDNYTDYSAAEIRSFFHELPVGQKVWSSPTIAAGQIWVASSSGTMESADPNNDVMGQGQLQVLDMEAQSLLPNSLPEPMGKIRGSLYVSHGHVYGTGIDGSVIQLGNEDFSAGTGNSVLLKTWLQE